MKFLDENPLFSTIVSLYILLLLYFPFLSLQFILSPVILSTLILLLYLLRLGASQKSPIGRSESDSAEPQQIEEFLDGDCKPDSDSDPRPFYTESFVEWDVRAPLNVIYEEYEGEDEDSEEKRETQMDVIRRYASLSLFYPESDSDASSEGDFLIDGDWGTPEKCFRWEEEDDREGMIEIALGEKRSSEVDEDNLIEIDLSPAR